MAVTKQYVTSDLTAYVDSNGLIQGGVQSFTSQAAFNASLTPGAEAVGLVNGVLYTSSDGISSFPALVNDISRSVVIFGDSITALNTFLPGQTNDRGYFTWANAYLNGYFTLLNNAGVGGNTTGMMLSRISADVLSYHPSWVIYMGGINDAFNSSTIPIETALANDYAIMTQLLNSGIKLVILGITPSANFTAGQGAYAHRMNEQKKAFCRNRNGCMYVDVGSRFIDPTSTNYFPVTSWMTDSLTHPTNAAAQVMGKQIANAVSQFIPVNQMTTSLADQCSTSNPYGNLVPNPIMNGSGGGATPNSGTIGGTIATNWNVINISGNQSVVCTAPARSDYPNLNQQNIAITFSAAGQEVQLNFYLSISSLISTGVLVPGITKLTGQAEITISGVSGTYLRHVYFGVQAWNGDVSPAYGGSLFYDTSGANAVNSGNLQNCAITPVFDLPFTLPSGGVSSINGLIGVVSNGAGTLTLSIGRVEIRPLQTV